MTLTKEQFETFQNRLDEFRELFDEFVREYPQTKGGQHHLRLYPEGRSRALESFEEIRQDRDEGRDITDRVLLELLPYKDTEHNRSQGAWIHVAPVFTKDVRQFFEGAGRATPDDWPLIARTIFGFYESCFESPDDLAQACERFASEIPAKGFQAGTLSPALNALRQDAFVVFNKKSREVLNYLTGSSFSTNLSEYPAANAAQLALISEAGGVMRETPELEQLSPVDRFDMFCHWLVAEKKHRLRPISFWKIAPGKEAWNWKNCRDNGFIAMGWDEMGDVSRLTRGAFNELNKGLGDQHEDWTPSAAAQLWTFARQINAGDKVVANHGKREVLGIGTVTGPYYFVEGIRHGHRLPVEWEDTGVRPVKKAGWMKTLVKLSQEEYEEIERTPPVEPQPSRVSNGGVETAGVRPLTSGPDLFSERTFELLGLLDENPTRDTYNAHKDEFKKHVERPFQELMRRVAAELPRPILDTMETERGVFSRIPKNDWGRGGAWPFYWGAFYPKGGKRLEEAQLIASVNSGRLEFGFYIGEYGSRQRRQFESNCEAYRDALTSVFAEFIVSDGLTFGSRDDSVGTFTDQPKREDNWQAWLERLDELGIRAGERISRDQLLTMSAADVVRHVASAFSRLFPLVLLASSEEPMAAIAEYTDQEEDEAPESAPVYSLDDFSAKTHIDPEELRRWVRAVERKKQAVFYGPPGTGKTFVAERMARHLIGGTDGFFEVVQFHPAYSYEDFMQGLRPTATAQGSLQFKMEQGRFLSFCARAQSRKGPCVLIIDEINRANLARVFGELMYLLEYREMSVPLAGGGCLRIPDNVRLIGTMNTADRSIALVDHALRRRFAFIPLYPQYDVLRKFHGSEDLDPEPLIQLLQRVNRAIGDRHYEVGISFFLQRSLTSNLEDIWRMEIEPYLEEYFFDQPTKVDEFRWDKVASQVMR